MDYQILENKEIMYRQLTIDFLSLDRKWNVIILYFLQLLLS